MSTTVWPSTDVVNISLAHGRDRRVARDQHAHDAAQRLDPERQRRHVQQQHVGDAAGQDVGLDRRAQGHDLVRIELAVGRPAEQLLHPPPHQRHPRRAAHQHHLVDLRRRRARRRRAPSGTGRASRSTSGSISRSSSARVISRRYVNRVERDRERRPLVGRRAGTWPPRPPSRSSCIASGSRDEVDAVLRPDVVEQPHRRARGRSRRRRDGCSPLVASTSKMPSLTLRIEMSNVPPPRS